MIMSEIQKHGQEMEAGGPDENTNPSYVCMPHPSCFSVSVSKPIAVVRAVVVVGSRQRQRGKDGSSSHFLSTVAYFAPLQS